MTFRTLVPAAALGAACLFAPSVRADVVEEVELFMAEHRIEFGYDADADACAFIGTDVRVVHVPVSSPNFLVARNATVKVAERNARAEIMKLVSTRMSGARATRLETDGSAYAESTESLVDVFSNEPLHGCETVCVREEKDGDTIRVAVAMKWSAAAEAEAVAAKRGAVDFDALSEADEWTAWASTYDFASSGTTASFTGSDGIRRWVGIGLADIEGKTGISLAAAQRAARQAAGAELAYALFGEAEAQSVAHRLKEASSDGAGTSETLSAQEFENRVTLSVKAKTVRDGEVYTTTVVHPLSGRKLYVSVVGIEPRDLAEMNLLGKAGGGARRRETFERPEHPSRPEHPNRPDHSARPERPSRPEHPNRPDHSFRPASNRPEHPSRRPRADEAEE